MNNVEILAPAGGIEQLQAAVRAGADAVYLGYGNFNARRNAKNFDIDTLTQAVNYCHVHGVKVHGAVNTLIKDSEMAEALDTAGVLLKVGCDALILQDMGLARLIKKAYPTAELHASTQLTAHDLMGVTLLKEAGFKRVVLSRELSLEEIRYITKNAGCQIEVFIHGALCMCVSGGCYLSSILGGRSGNRGLCAQPCRLDFKTEKREYALSLKDMCNIEYINSLREAGVVSFKIEGRMKRPEYVYAATRACRDALNKKKPDIEGLKAVFSRSGFTTGYIEGRRNADMFGYRKKDDVIAAEGVLKQLQLQYKDEVQNVNVTATFTLKADMPATLTLSDGVNRVTVAGDIPQKAISRSTTEEDIKKQLLKTGGTPYSVTSVMISLEDGLVYPISGLNLLRREAVSALTKKRISLPKVNAQPIDISLKQAKREMKNDIVLRVESLSQLSRIESDLPVILPINEIEPAVLSRFTYVIGEIPSLVFPFSEEKLIEALAEKKVMGLKYVFCNNIGAVKAADRLDLIPIGGWGLNILNSFAAAEYGELGVKAFVASFETSVSAFNAFSVSMPKGIIGYGYLPLMRMRACPLKEKNGCNGCNGHGTVTDRKNVTFPLICNDRQFTTLYNSLPLYVGDKNIQADFHLLYFTSETGARVKQIVQLYGNAPDMPRTTGLYFKQLL